MLLLGHTSVPSVEIEARVALFAKKVPGEIDFIEFLRMMVRSLSASQCGYGG